MKISVSVDLANCMHVKLTRELALRFLESIIEIHGETRDLEEAVRLIAGFDEYYKSSQRKFEGYLAVPKDTSDAIRGRVIVHKIKLLLENREKYVELVLDRRVSRELVARSLSQLGFSEAEFSPAT
ncbi:MAG: hypothetical protein QXK88_04445 [Desulfurococcaceae archaeon]